MLLLAGTLACAIVRPRGLPEAAVAVPAAGLLLVLGVLPLGQAGTEAGGLGPTIGFLAAVLALANLCDRHGLFEAAGSWMAAGSGGRPVSLLVLVFAAASVVTAVLSLDATVVSAHPGRVRDRCAAPPPGKAARVRVHASRELRVAVAAGLEPHQPAGIRREWSLVRSIRSNHGTPVAGRHRRRMVGVSPFLCWRPGWPRYCPRDQAASGTSVRGRRGCAHARRLLRHVGLQCQPGIRGARRRTGPCRTCNCEPERRVSGPLRCRSTSHFSRSCWHSG